MSTSIDDIWDQPVAPPSPRPAQPIQVDSDDQAPIRTRATATATSTRRPLFLADSDDEVAPEPRNKPGPDVGAIFAEVMDDDSYDFAPLAPNLDLQAIARQAEQRHALSQHAIMPSSSPPRDMGESFKRRAEEGEDGKKKKRVRIMRLDEARLLNTTYGFPALIDATKDFKPKGKGHEVRLLIQVSSFKYTHPLHLRLQGERPEQPSQDLPVLDTPTVPQDAVQGHSRAHREDMPQQTHAGTSSLHTTHPIGLTIRMQVSLSVWRDAAKGLGPSDKPDAAIDLTSDTEPAGADNPPARARSNSAAREASPPPASSPPSSSRSSLPPEFDDFDIDDLIGREEAAAAAAPGIGPRDEIDDDDLWAELDAPGPPAPAPVVRAPLDDDDVWDIAREMEMEMEADAKAKASASNSGPPSPPPQAADPQSSAPAEAGPQPGAASLAKDDEYDSDDLYK
jgi:replication fork protection complex subunit Csm3/Swi3